MGPSGSGKSTLLHLLGALETPSAGTIELAGRRFEGLGDAELTAASPRHDRLRVPVLQPAAGADRGGERAAAGADRRAPDAEMRARATELLRPGRARRARRPPPVGALRRRAAARLDRARAAAASPSWCSPTSRPATSTRIRAPRCSRCSRELNRDEGHTIVMVTHDPSAAATAGRVMFLRDGASPAGRGWSRSACRRFTSSRPVEPSRRRRDGVGASPADPRRAQPRAGLG